MFVHVFGAYFGLAISFVFGMKDRPKEDELEGSSYHSDLFAMIGMLYVTNFFRILTNYWINLYINDHLMF